MGAVKWNLLTAWSSGDSPGCGSTVRADQAATQTAINGNWYLIDEWFTKLFNVVTGNMTATLKDDIIGKAQLAADVVDNVDLQKNAGTDALEIKAVPVTKIAAGSLGTGLAISGNQLVLSSVSSTQLADDAVTAAKIADNNNKTKDSIVIALKAGTAEYDYAVISGVQSDSATGVRMLRDGSITGVSHSNSGGGGVVTYTAGTHTFSAGDVLNVRGMSTGLEQFATFGIIRNNSLLVNFGQDTSTGATFCMLEFEYDA